MRASAKAGIEFTGAVMRYSEVERYGSRFRLLRLGNCDFEFDVSEVLFGSGEYLDSVAEAVSDVFSGSAATTFRIAVHPPAASVFTSAAPAGMSEALQREHLSFEAALLHPDESSGRNVRIYLGQDISHADGSDSRRVQIAYISTVAQDRLRKATSRISEADVEFIASSEAVARVIEKMGSREKPTSENQLAVGLYDAYTEFTVMQNGKWIFGQERQETNPSDIAYFALFVLQASGLNVSETVDVRLYGDRMKAEARSDLYRVFGDHLSLLNPISILDLQADQFDEGFAFESFVPCLGAAL